MSRVSTVFFLAVWFLALGVGLWFLAKYDSTPGSLGAPAPDWPTQSCLGRPSNRATLVMLAHPRCPCTRASVSELAILMTRCTGKVNAYVLFFAPRGASADWAKTDIWYSAAAIPGVTVLKDEQGAEAQRFHAETSGETLLYDSSGRLVFQGGITDGRGHEGDNAGRTSVEDFLLSGRKPASKSPVFGCALSNPPSDSRPSGASQKAP